MDFSTIIAIIGIVISVISFLLSIYTFYKTKFDERFRYDKIISSCVAVSDVPLPLGITYIEMTVTNKSTLPIPIVNANIRVELKDMFIKTTQGNPNIVEAEAHRFDTLISTFEETAGTVVNRIFEHKSNALPLTIPPKDSKHFILAFPTPYVMSMDPKNTTVNLVLYSHKKNRIEVNNNELSPVMKSTRDFFAERIREA